MTAPVRALSFDVDGTLYRVRRLRVAWRLRSERGLLVALMAARERIRHESPLESGEALLARESELVAPSFGLTLEEARQRLTALHAELPAALTRGARAYPGVKNALEAAHARGIRLAILSDYAPEEKLKWLGLDSVPWSAAIGCDRLGALKPHGAAFLELARTLDVAPESIVHIGDREDLDVDGALRAGLRAWRFARRPVSATRAERVFGEWSVGVFRALFPGEPIASESKKD